VKLGISQEDEAMGTLNNWDITILIVAGYLAVVALIRLMTRRRDQLIDELHRQIEAENKRKFEEARRNSA
jgi:hypothetical protein